MEFVRAVQNVKSGKIVSLGTSGGEGPPSSRSGIITKSILISSFEWVFLPPATPSSLSRTIEGLFELTRRLTRALNLASYVATGTTYKDTRTPSDVARYAQRSPQEQLPETLIVFMFSLIQKLGGGGGACLPWPPPNWLSVHTCWGNGQLQWTSKPALRWSTESVRRDSSTTTAGLAGHGLWPGDPVSPLWRSSGHSCGKRTPELSSCSPELSSASKSCASNTGQTQSASLRFTGTCQSHC